MMGCPRDTDGDGDCGNRHCPDCGTSPAADQHRERRAHIEELRCVASADAKTTSDWLAEKLDRTWAGFPASADAEFAKRVFLDSLIDHLREAREKVGRQ